jgi:Predicted transcriptional regulator
VLPAPTRTATFLPDLTAIVAGGAAAHLSRLLDDTAEVERRDTASSWRFTPASVRRALDAGNTPDGLLAALADVADKPLPQPLEYLVRDVARRHGQLQVFAVASCVRVADAALGAEVAAHRALAALNLRVLADTVLASSKPIGETVAALRKAGYAPVRQDARGATVVEKAPVRRADPARSLYPAPPAPQPPDLGALAARLAGELPAEVAPVTDCPLAAEEVPLLPSSDAAVLGHAIEHRLPVLIEYVNAAGNTSTRVIEPRMKLFGTLVAWCRSKRADRNFALDRITAASPADV